MTDDEMLTDIAEKLTDFFKGDKRKAKIWLHAPNPMFGFMSAKNLIDLGRVKRVWQCVNNAIEGNYP